MKCLPVVQRIVKERRHETSLSIYFNGLMMPSFAVIAEAITGNSSISGLEVMCWPKNEHIVLIAGILTHPDCSIRVLTFSLAASVDFLPLAHALQKNRTITQLQFCNRTIPLYSPFKLKDLDCIFQVLAGKPVGRAEDNVPAATSTSVRTLHLKGFSWDDSPKDSLNLMLEKNRTISELVFTLMDFCEFVKLKTGLSNNPRLSLLSLVGTSIPPDELPNIVSCLPPHLEVLNLDHTCFFNASIENLIEGLINLIKKCKEEKLSLHISFNGALLARDGTVLVPIEKYQDELRELLSDESKVSLECDALKGPPFSTFYKERNLGIAFFSTLVAAKLNSDEALGSPFTANQCRS